MIKEPLHTHTAYLCCMYDMVNKYDISIPGVCIMHSQVQVGFYTNVS